MIPVIRGTILVGGSAGRMRFDNDPITSRLWLHGNPHHVHVGGRHKTLSEYDGDDTTDYSTLREERI